MALQIKVKKRAKDEEKKKLRERSYIRSKCGK